MRLGPIPPHRVNDATSRGSRSSSRFPGCTAPQYALAARMPSIDASGLVVFPVSAVDSESLKMCSRVPAATRHDHVSCHLAPSGVSQRSSRLMRSGKRSSLSKKHIGILPLREADSDGIQRACQKFKNTISWKN